MQHKLYIPALNASFLLALLAVIIGALNAHAFKKILTPEQIESCTTAVKYQFYHSIALSIVGVLYAFIQNKWLKRTFVLFLIGTILFSGSIYLMIALQHNTGISIGKFGLLTPVGGLCLMSGWVCLIIGVNIKHKSS